MSGLTVKLTIIRGLEALKTRSTSCNEECDVTIFAKHQSIDPLRGPDAKQQLESSLRHYSHSSMP